MLRIAQAHSSADLAAVRDLFQDYWKAFGFTPCFQGFDTEVATLPGKYAPPTGRLLLARFNNPPDDQPAGCVALRAFDQTRGEMKRMFVRPAFRGHRIGEALLTTLINEARTIGYAELLADTIPGVMTTALAMYERHGFERIAPYSADTPCGAHLRLRL